MSRPHCVLPVRCIVLLGLVALASPSCSTRTRQVGGAAAAIQTDRDRYVLEPSAHGHETRILIRFTAPRDTAVHILHCNGAIGWGLQRQVNGRWTNVWVVETNACLSRPIVVPGGGVYEDTLVAYSRTDIPPGPGPVQHEIPPGTYRVVGFHFQTSFDPDARPFGAELPLEQRVSAPIILERAP
jgi:hypothetical protein